MKLSHLLCTACIGLSLAACGTDKETIVRERPAQPVVVETSSPNSGMNPSSVESTCKHGYDNSSHSCY